MKKYEIQLSSEQLNTIKESLDFYMRFIIGQWRVPQVMEAQEMVNQKDTKEFWETSKHVDDQLNILSSMFTKLPLNASYGVNSALAHEHSKIAYDISRPIYELFNKEYRDENPDEATYSVYDSPGLSYSKEGRITIKTIEDE